MQRYFSLLLFFTFSFCFGSESDYKKIQEAFDNGIKKAQTWIPHFKSLCIPAPLILLESISNKQNQAYFEFKSALEDSGINITEEKVPSFSIDSITVIKNPPLQKRCEALVKNYDRKGFVTSIKPLFCYLQKEEHFGSFIDSEKRVICIPARKAAEMSDQNLLGPLLHKLGHTIENPFSFLSQNDRLILTSLALHFLKPENSGRANPAIIKAACKISWLEEFYADMYATFHGSEATQSLLIKLHQNFMQNPIKGIEGCNTHPSYLERIKRITSTSYIISFHNKLLPSEWASSSISLSNQ
jgi:hypothetical protein